MLFKRSQYVLLQPSSIEMSFISDSKRSWSLKTIVLNESMKGYQIRHTSRTCVNSNNQKHDNKSRGNSGYKQKLSDR